MAIKQQEILTSYASYITKRIIYFSHSKKILFFEIIIFRVFFKYSTNDKLVKQKNIFCARRFFFRKFYITFF